MARQKFIQVETESQVHDFFPANSVLMLPFEEQEKVRFMGNGVGLHNGRVVVRSMFGWRSPAEEEVITLPQTMVCENGRVRKWNPLELFLRERFAQKQQNS